MFDSYKEHLIRFYRDNRRLPVYTEMMRLFGFKSKNAVFKLVQKFIDAGLVEKDSAGHLSPRNLFGSTPVLGLVEAGIPTPAEADLLDGVSLDDMLIRRPGATYMLEVKGDSMIDEGIREGDLVIVERANDARDGDIVIAEVDGGWTVKFLRKKSGRVFLEPANSKYKPIYPEHDMRIAAVVKGVVRRY